MGSVSQLRRTVRVGSHHDASEEWARPPRLRTVVDLRGARRHAQSRAFAKYVLVFAVGYLIGVWL